METAALSWERAAVRADGVVRLRAWRAGEAARAGEEAHPHDRCMVAYTSGSLILTATGWPLPVSTEPPTMASAYPPGMTSPSGKNGETSSPSAMASTAAGGAR